MLCCKKPGSGMGILGGNCSTGSSRGVGTWRLSLFDMDKTRRE
eukprot:gene26990-biopygen17562